MRFAGSGETMQRCGTDRPLWFRVSAVEAGGVWGIEETLALAKALKSAASMPLIVLPVASAVTVLTAGASCGFQAGYSSEIGIQPVCPPWRWAPHEAQRCCNGACRFHRAGPRPDGQPNWPLHAARTLGVGDPLALVHPREARLRQLLFRDYPPGSAIEIPSARKSRCLFLD
jgi:hypothetical protein